MAEGLCQVAALEDPIGEVLSMKKRPNGLLIGQKRVPLGVVGIIYEARPNVTADAFALCFKTGNVVILKGGSDALHSNQAIVESIQHTLGELSLPETAIQLICDTSHETAEKFMRMNGYVDVLIPRGGAGLIRTVVKNATVPVIETGTGNCHIFVDESADFDMAVNIIYNAKTQRIGVCNACESIVIHEKIVDAFMPVLAERLKEKHVEIRGDERVMQALAGQEDVKKATEEDWGTEYLDYILSIKVVYSVDEAIAHINRYNTGHSEAIITNDYTNAQKELTDASNQGSTEALLVLGMVYGAQSDYANARAMYQQYINQKLDDTSGDQTQTTAQGYNGLAVCDMAEGNYDSALENISSGISIASDDEMQSLLFNEIVAYEKKLDFATALTKAQEYVDMFPEDSAAKKELAFLKTRTSSEG